MPDTKRFYFTYGTDGHPFHGGWTEIEAPDFHVACAVFKAYHPNKTDGLLNCSTVYSEEEFKKTGMAGLKGNFGQGCQEIITVRRETATI